MNLFKAILPMTYLTPKRSLFPITQTHSLKISEQYENLKNTEMRI